MTKKETITALMEKYKGRFSTELGIDLFPQKSGEIFKWFLASVLFGARISESIVIKAYREFEKQEILSPKAILDTGWDGLVQVLDRGGYVRYDFKTATKLLDISRALLGQYQGDLNVLHSAASDPKDLEQRLKSLAKGIGDVTVNIFLREMRGIWQKAEPLPSELVITAAQDMRIIPKGVRDRRTILELLMKTWRDTGGENKDFSDFEAALVRAGKEVRRSRLPRAHR